MDSDILTKQPVSSPSSLRPRATKIITLIHKDTTVPGVIGKKLIAMGYDLDIRAPILGDTLPTNLADYAAALVFGGPMSVNDNEPYLQAELAWIKQVLLAKLHYLGFC